MRKTFYVILIVLLLLVIASIPAFATQKNYLFVGTSYSNMFGGIIGLSLGERTSSLSYDFSLVAGIPQGFNLGLTFN